jgi:hypothetical protein
VRFLPQPSRLFSRAGIAFEDRETANGVGKIERPSLLVVAIERQGFVVAGLGQLCTSRIVMNIAEMPNRVREPERLVQLAEDGDGFLIVLSRGIGVREASLELAQVSEHLCQLCSGAFLPYEINGEEEIALGVC